MRNIRKVFIITFGIIFCIWDIFAQQHYKGVSGIELNYGTNIFGHANNYLNLSYSKYINRESYWKIGTNYFEKQYSYATSQTNNPDQLIQKATGKDIYIDAAYNRTLATNLKSVYWGLGIGTFIGIEYTRHLSKEYQFIIGPKIETELELFIYPRIALLTRLQQFWNPLSFHEWNTVWNLGIKVLLY